MLGVLHSIGGIVYGGQGEQTNPGALDEFNKACGARVGQV
jgi:hypothetical protein